MILLMIDFAFVSYGLATRSVSAQQTALRVDAPAEADPAVSTTFNVVIWIEDVPSPGFYGYEYWLSWTPGLINCTLETLNTTIWSTYSVWITEPIDNAAGTYHQSMTALYPATPKTGTYWLANLTFLIITQTPISVNLTLSPPEGATYCIADKQGTQIPHDFIDGTVNIIPEFLGAMLLSMFVLSTSISLLMARKLRK
jgi:hypothetical protein